MMKTDLDTLWTAYREAHAAADAAKAALMAALGASTEAPALGPPTRRQAAKPPAPKKISPDFTSDLDRIVDLARRIEVIDVRHVMDAGIKTTETRARAALGLLVRTGRLDTPAVGQFTLPKRAPGSPRRARARGRPPNPMRTRVLELAQRQAVISTADLRRLGNTSPSQYLSYLIAKKALVRVGPDQYSLPGAGGTGLAGVLREAIAARPRRRKPPRRRRAQPPGEAEKPGEPKNSAPPTDAGG